MEHPINLDETIRQLSQKATDLSVENFISFWNGDQMEQLMEVNVPYIYVIANNVK